MKIAILTSGGVDPSGVERVIPCFLALIERLSRAGDEVHVFALSQGAVAGVWRLRGATIHGAGRDHPGRRMVAQLAAEHRIARFDVIHASWSVFASLAGVGFGRLFRVPTLVYFGAAELADLPGIATPRSSRLGRLMLRLAVTGADRIAVQSVPMVEQARGLGIAARRLALGVAPDRWPPARARRRDPTAPARLLHVGALVPVRAGSSQGSRPAAGDGRRPPGQRPRLRDRHHRRRRLSLRGRPAAR